MQRKSTVKTQDAQFILCLFRLFPGEQHGFRKSENIKTALDGEFYFYSRVFGFKAADNDVKVEKKL